MEPEQTREDDHVVSHAVPATDPLRIAWDAYVLTDAYANSRRWAVQAGHTEGALWSAFTAGWTLAPLLPTPTAHPREGGDPDGRWIELAVNHLDLAAEALRQHGDAYRADLVAAGAHAIRMGVAASSTKDAS